MIDRPRPVECEPHTFKTSVLVVGGSLSGLVLSKSLQERCIDHIVVEASKDKNASIHYLTSLTAAQNLGLETQYHDHVSRRTPITGYSRLDGQAQGVVALEKVAPSQNRQNAFATFSLRELCEWITPHAGPIISGASVSSVTTQEDNTWTSKTANGLTINSDIVIDATGARAHIVGNLLQSEAVNKKVNHRVVRACYGGVYSYEGPEDSLFFADRFPIIDPTLPREGAGWIMPLGNGLAEIVVGWETPFSEINHWRKANLRNLITHYIDWFNKRGIPIHMGNRKEVVSGFFSQELLDYRSIPHNKGIAVFGESLGLNHPLNGYLIRNISNYAHVMADEVTRFLVDKKWSPHDRLIGERSVNYGQQVALSRMKIEAVKTGSGRSAATAPLQEFLLKTIGENGLWEAIDNGVPLSTLIVGLLKNPQYTSKVAQIGLAYAKILWNEDLYRHELLQKLINRMHNKIKL